MPFPAINALFDPFFPKGLQWYWKGDFVKSLPDEAIDTHIAQAAHGAERALPDAPLPDRRRRAPRGEGRHGLERARRDVVDGDRRHRSRSEERRRAEGVGPRAYWKAVHPFNLAGAYVNFMMDDEADGRVQATYGDNYARLA